MSVNPTSLAVPTGLKAWLLTDTPGILLDRKDLPSAGAGEPA